MREIKFRAWNDKANLMFTPFVIVPGNFPNSERPLPQDVDLMQYTGLKDKRGRDIYEGDIIRFGHARETFIPLEPTKTIAPVVYTYGGSMLIETVLERSLIGMSARSSATSTRTRT
jgi:uncharacterized phage protein (TIGR01671 family)